MSRSTNPRTAATLCYVEALAAADAFHDKVLEAALIQTLSEIAKALVEATKGGVVEAKR